MYTETQQAIRNSLWNFMGSLLTASMYEDNRNKESVTAIFTEELCKFCKTEDNKIDILAAKPILKSCIWILQSRKVEIESLPVKTEAINNTIEELDKLIASLDVYVNKI